MSPSSVGTLGGAGATSVVDNPSTSAPELLCRVDFPLYGLSVISNRHLLLAGGGGAAKTGVKNGFEIFELHHSGTRTVAESVTRFDSGDRAVMNLASARYDAQQQKVVVACGHDEQCQLYELQLYREKGRRTSASANGYALPTSAESPPSRLSFAVTPIKSIQTDFGTPEPYQKVVRFSPNNQYMATGGDDGKLRVWNCPDLYRTHEINAHEKEIDDLDFSPDNSKIVTISKDRRAYVWDVKKGKKHAELGWDPPKGTKYMFKRVRFARLEGSSKFYKVFSIVNPVGASKPPSYLQRWDSKTYRLEQNRAYADGGGSLSALAVSDHGHFVATGSMFDGTVEIFTAFNLQRLKRVEKSHSTFITGLEFLPSAEEFDVIRGFNEASVVSISVDHQVCIHHVPRRRTLSIFTAMLLVSAAMVMVFILASYLGV